MPLGGAALFIVALVALTGRFIVGYHAVSPDALPASPMTSTLRAPVADEVAEPQAAVPAMAPASGAAVYLCEVNGVSASSATPCPDNARAQQADSQPPVGGEEPVGKPASAVLPVAPAVPLKPPPASGLCDAIAQELRDVQLALRRPYPEARGNYLHARLQQLSEELSEQRCGH